MTNASDTELKKQTSFLGQPKGVGSLSFMQLCNSFSSYGMTAVLIYYLYAKAPAGLGFPKDMAAQLVSLYSGALALTGIIGSYVCDRILGCRKSLLVARFLNFLGFVFLALPLGTGGYVASMVCLAVGPMFGGRCLEALLGKFYERSDARRDSAYTISYVISNIGAAAPVIAGIVANAMGYRSAFALSAILAFLGLVVYLVTYKPFFGNIGIEPDDPLPASKKRSFIIRMVVILAAAIAVIVICFATGKLTVSAFVNAVSTISIIIPILYFVVICVSRKTSKEERRRVLCLIPAFFCNAVTLLIWTQTTSILAIFYDEKVNRVLFGYEMSPASFQTIPAVWAIIIGSIFTAMWTKLGKHQPFGTTKMGIGTIFWGAGAMIIALLYVLYPGDIKINPLWIVLFYFVLMAGEGFTCPTGYSLSSLAAPKAFLAQMITVWSMSQAIGAGMNTLAINFYHKGSEIPFFLGIGAVQCP